MKYLKLIFCIFAISYSFAQTSDSTSSYISIHYRGSATISIDEQTYSGQFNLVNVIDSFLYIQLNVAGFEAGRILITPDQILLINKLQKNYYEGDYTIFQHLIGVDIDFYTIQAIFNGFPIDIPDGIELSYQGELIVDEFSFFNRLIFESTDYELKLQLDIKKVTFNDVPKVSATIPKNYSVIRFYVED